MNLRQLECFYAVADELHFGRAAASLHLSQASLSQAIAALERHAGGRLLNRTTRRVSLTAFGAEFLAATRPHYQQLVAAYTLARVRNQPDGELIIAHTPELGHLLLPSLAATATVPSWRPLGLHTHSQIRAVADGRVDIGLCWTPTVDPPLAITQLARCPFAVVLSPDDELSARHDLRLPDLRGRKIVVSPRQDNLFIDSRMQATLLQSGLASANLEEVSGYDELALRVVSRRQVGIHPATIATLNRVPGVIFRRLDEPGLLIDISAVHLANHVPLLGAVVAALGSIAQRVMDDVTTALNAPPGA